ncbi:MAG TPA: metallophosphoesterase family protein [Candidatus Agathobaculum intestinipullorum]|nr:metallophosphoesterase [uncultured Agathobaculum sp.]HJA47859.1 metallophosphoesterase family protein [Candidatus Agathobaculum intestinipullorum]
MNILTLADVESPPLWDPTQPYRLKDADLILSCGDLSPDYLSFIATYSHAPVLYVHGNHDDIYASRPPLGCINIEDQIYCHQGVRILGLGGSIRYKNGIHQYTQSEMNRRIWRLWFSLWRHGGFDILLTHAPGHGMNDGPDLPHQGFRAFPSLLTRYTPAYMVHGHTHLNYGLQYPRESQFGQTTVINAYGWYQITL